MHRELINTFLKICVEASRDILNVNVQKESVNISYGKKFKGPQLIVYKILGDINGVIFIDFSLELIKYILNTFVKNNPILTKDVISIKNEQFKDIGIKFATDISKSLSSNGLKCTLSEPYLFPSSGISIIPDDIVCLDVNLNIENMSTLNVVFTDTLDNFFTNDLMIFYNCPNVFMDAIIFNFIPRGLIVYEPQNHNELIYTVSNRKINFLVIALDENNSNISDLLNELNDKSLLKPLSIIAYNNNNFDLKPVLNGYKNLKLLGSIKNNISIIDTMNKIKDLISIAGVKQEDRRRYSRIYFDKFEKIKVHFRLPNSDTIINGLLRNISLGGMNIQLEESYHNKTLKSNVDIKGINLFIEDKVLITDGFLNSKKGNILSIKFVDTKDAFIQKISEIIHQRTANQ